MHWNLTRTRTLSSLSVVSPGSVDPFVSTSRFWRSQSRAKHCAQLNMTSNSNNRIIATSLYTKIASLLIQISPDFFFARQAKHMVLDIALLLGWAEVNCGAFRPRWFSAFIQTINTKSFNSIAWKSTLPCSMFGFVLIIYLNRNHGKRVSTSRFDCRFLFRFFLFFKTAQTRF